jgi:hypothetical protein
MKFIDYGLGVLSKSLFDMYKDNEVFDLADINTRINNKKLSKQDGEFVRFMYGYIIRKLKYHSLIMTIMSKVIF